MLPLTCFSLSIDDHVAHLVLNRPETLNTMHPTFWRELDGVLDQLHRDAQARVLVISSTGKHFSAGMALDAFGGELTLQDQTPEGRAAVFDQLMDLQSTFTRLETLRIPVVVALHGGCIGGAVDLVTAACIRYASADTFFCIQEINIGLVADVGTLQRLPKLMPMALVKHRSTLRRRASQSTWSGERGVCGCSGNLGRRHAMRQRNCSQATRGDLGHQASLELRARSQRGRRPETNGLVARRYLEQRACGRGNLGFPNQAACQFSGLAGFDVFSRAVNLIAD
jgi:hypothetical protein